MWVVKWSSIVYIATKAKKIILDLFNAPKYKETYGFVYKMHEILKKIGATIDKLNLFRFAIVFLLWIMSHIHIYFGNELSFYVHLFTLCLSHLFPYAFFVCLLSKQSGEKTWMQLLSILINFSVCTTRAMYHVENQFRANFL